MKTLLTILLATLAHATEIQVSDTPVMGATASHTTAITQLAAPASESTLQVSLTIHAYGFMLNPYSAPQNYTPYFSVNSYITLGGWSATPLMSYATGPATTLAPYHHAGDSFAWDFLFTQSFTRTFGAGELGSGMLPFTARTDVQGATGYGAVYQVGTVAVTLESSQPAFAALAVVRVPEGGNASCMALMAAMALAGLRRIFA